MHIIINNQIGFTTSDVRDTRSTLYCTDVVKMIEAPVFHVNGDDPEAVVLATEIAFDFRSQFQKDVVIDLVCFRRHGHNEQDEPMVTQPLMYKSISPASRHPQAVRREAGGAGRRSERTRAEEMIKVYRAALDGGYHTNKTILVQLSSALCGELGQVQGRASGIRRSTPRCRCPSSRALAEKLTTVPPEFKLHPRVEKVIADRRQMGAGQAAARLGHGGKSGVRRAAQGRLCRCASPGRTAARGTFFHRHAVLHDQARERWDAGAWVPLQHIAENQPDFVVIDSVLSEEAVLGFEYGYATAEPNELVIWEAQFGDFVNGAQVVIDQFIASGEVKWGRMCGLVLMLPHGYEGQGPEHSSARLERFLQLCADYNMQICVPSTPAQMFHLLRRQMVRPYRKPLIIFSPKSMLRHKESVSTLEDLAHRRLPAGHSGDRRSAIRQRSSASCSAAARCTTIVRAARRERGIDDVAIVRLEQLYPFPHDEFKAEIDRYDKAKEIVWCQEEPGNQGAWHRIQHYLLRHMLPTQKLSYALRPSSASPAAGYLALHNEQQKAVVDAALTHGGREQDVPARCERALTRRRERSERPC